MRFETDTEIAVGYCIMSCKMFFNACRAVFGIIRFVTNLNLTIQNAAAQSSA
jgi:hypothetical protein